MRRLTPDMPREVAQQICWEESGDLRARWILIDLAESAYNSGESVAASLIHAAAYLENREQYQREPWPKNMIRLPIGADAEASA